MKNANEEIERTLNSLKGLKRADSGPFLYEKVMARIEKGEAIVVSIAPRLLWQAAAGMALLIAINVFVWSRNDAPQNNRPKESNPVATEYFSHLNPIQF